MNNMRRGFTMIELIFVIVIIGILAAVAIPKLAGVQGQAQAAKISAYAGTLTRTTIPPYWSESIMSGNLGSIKANGYPAKIIGDLDRPTDFAADPDFTAVEAAGYTFTDGTAGAETAKAVINGITYTLTCTDGTKSIAPVCDVYDGAKWILTNNR